MHSEIDCRKMERNTQEAGDHGLWWAGSTNYHRPGVRGGSRSSHLESNFSLSERFQKTPNSVRLRDDPSPPPPPNPHENIYAFFRYRLTTKRLAAKLWRKTLKYVDPKPKHWFGNPNHILTSNEFLPRPQRFVVLQKRTPMLHFHSVSHLLNNKTLQSIVLINLRRSHSGWAWRVLFTANSSASQHPETIATEKEERSLLCWNNKTLPLVLSFDWSPTACRRNPEGQIKLTETWTFGTTEKQFMWPGPKCLISLNVSVSSLDPFQKCTKCTPDPAAGIN